MVNLKVNNCPGLSIEICMGMAQPQETEKKILCNGKMVVFYYLLKIVKCPYKIFSNP